MHAHINTIYFSDRVEAVVALGWVWSCKSHISECSQCAFFVVKENKISRGWKKMFKRVLDEAALRHDPRSSRGMGEERQGPTGASKVWKDEVMLSAGPLWRAKISHTLLVPWLMSVRVRGGWHARAPGCRWRARPWSEGGAEVHLEDAGWKRKTYQTEIRMTNNWGQIYTFLMMVNNLAADWKQWTKNAWVAISLFSSFHVQMQTQLVRQTDRQASTLLAGSHESSTHLNILLSVLFLLLTCKCCVMRFGFSPLVISPLITRKWKKKE